MPILLFSQHQQQRALIHSQTSTPRNPLQQEQQQPHAISIAQNTIMFKQSKKKRSSGAGQRRNRVDQDDDDDEETMRVLFRPRNNTSKKSTRRVTTTRMQDDDDDEQDEDETKPSVNGVVVQEGAKRSKMGKNHNKKKRPRMAFGGGGPLVGIKPTRMQDDEDHVDDDEDHAPSLYDPEALRKLAAEQATYRVPLNAAAAAEDASDKKNQDTNNDPSPVLIVAGEEALQMAQDAAAAASETTPAGLVANHAKRGDDDDKEEQLPRTTPMEAGDWESQVERRAGISTTNHRLPPGLAATSTKTTTTKTTTLEQLRQTVQRTVVHLTQDLAESTTQLARRTAALEESRHRLVHTHEATLQTTGKSVEFYQGLRFSLVAWTGALRTLFAKVVPLQKALHAIQAGVAALTRATEWENDTLAILKQHGRLTKVVGRQPDPAELAMPEEETMTTVDEFGRNVVSQQELARQQRQRLYRTLQEERLEQEQQENQQDGLGSSLMNASTVTRKSRLGFVSQSEMEEWRQRHQALQQALEVGMQELDAEYTDLQALVDLFDGWRQHAPSDYQESYAPLSLADLAAVLILANVCALNDPWNESAGYNEAKWTAVVHAALQTGTLDETGVDRLVQKAVLPAVNDLLKQQGVALDDERAMRAMGDFVSHVIKVLPSHDGPALKQVQSHMAAYAMQQLDAIAVAVVSVRPTTGDTSPEVAQAIHAATVEQMHRVTSMTVHLIRYWAPVLASDAAFASHILSFLADAFLCLLSSVRQFQQSPLQDAPAEAFGLVWHELQASGWLARPDPSNAILQVAAQVFKVPSS